MNRESTRRTRIIAAAAYYFMLGVYRMAIGQVKRKQKRWWKVSLYKNRER